MEQCWPPARVLHLLAIAQQTRTLLQAIGRFATSRMLGILPTVVAGEYAAHVRLLRCYLVWRTHSSYLCYRIPQCMLIVLDLYAGFPVQVLNFSLPDRCANPDVDFLAMSRGRFEVSYPDPHTIPGEPCMRVDYAGECMSTSVPL